VTPAGTGGQGWPAAFTPREWLSEYGQGTRDAQDHGPVSRRPARRAKPPRRRTKPSRERVAFGLAFRLTGAWLLVGLLTFFPLWSTPLAHLVARYSVGLLAPETVPPLVIPSPPYLPEVLPWFVAGALAPAAAWWWAVRLFTKLRAAGKSLEQLRALSPDEFETWVAARFREQGYRARRTGQTGDHGVDVQAERRDEKVVVQCKRYRDTSIGEPVLRDLYGAMHHAGATRAVLATTGRISDAARAWAEDKPIDLWDGETLVRLRR
jgi:hypothetical protein